MFKDIIVWFEKQNNWIGWTCFTLLYMINIAILLPGIFMILGAGFVFGFWKGLLAVWLGGGIGQSLAFLLARYLVGDWVSALARGKSKKWDVIDKAMEMEGWKLLLLVRLSPLVPYNLLNICMAATKIHFWQFAVVSFFGAHAHALCAGAVFVPRVLAVICACMQLNVLPELMHGSLGPKQGFCAWRRSHSGVCAIYLYRCGGVLAHRGACSRAGECMVSMTVSRTICRHKCMLRTDSLNAHSEAALRAGVGGRAEGQLQFRCGFIRSS